MGLFNFKNTVNPATETREFWSGAIASLGLGEYSDVVLKLCIAPIIDELKKVEFYCTNPQYDLKTRDTIKFLNTKYSTIYKYFFKKGFCAVKIDASGNITFDNFCTIKSKSEFEKELNNPISSFSFEYDFFNKSQYDLLESIFENVNTGLTAQKAVTKILGQFTIFSKEKEGANERVVPLTNDERDKYVKKYGDLFSGNNVGTSVEFTNANLKRDTILFPLDKLQIVDQITFNILLIAGVLNVPYDLIPLTGKSTYANQESAREYLRTNTVNGIAENMLELGRKILTAKEKLVPKSAIDFRVIESAVKLQQTNTTIV